MDRAVGIHPRRALTAVPLCPAPYQAPDYRLQAPGRERYPVFGVRFPVSYQAPASRHLGVTWIPASAGMTLRVRSVCLRAPGARCLVSGHRPRPSRCFVPANQLPGGCSAWRRRTGGQRSTLPRPCCTLGGSTGNAGGPCRGRGVSLLSVGPERSLTFRPLFARGAKVRIPGCRRPDAGDRMPDACCPVPSIWAAAPSVRTSPRTWSGARVRGTS
jgi:hypothetical protein